MTFEDFEKAKIIDHKIGIAAGNLVALRRITENAYGHPFSQHSYRIKVDDSPSSEMLVDLDFIEMVIEYYEREIKTLNEQFEALGKENK